MMMMANIQRAHKAENTISHQDEFCAKAFPFKHPIKVTTGV